MIFKSKFFRNVETKKMSLEERKRLVDSFPEPRDDIDRTAFQYRCRFVNARKGKMLLFNIAGFFAAPVLALLYLLNHLSCRQKEHHNAVLINEKFLAGMSYQNKMPPQLYEEFGEVHPLDFDKYPDLVKGVLNGKALGCWWKLFVRHPLSGFMNLLCLVHIASMNRIIIEHSPRAVVNYMSEFNFASSLLTHFCEEQGIEYICFMHGDYLVNEGRAFVRYSRMYLWDEHYRGVFNWSRCPEEQYRFYFPEMYNLRLPETGGEPEYYLTYYFSGNDNSAQVVLDVMKACTRAGKKCKVRPHPRYTDIPMVKAMFEEAGILVEEPLELKLEDSVANTQCVAARCSTVLTQAYYAGKDVVIDDISDPQFYREMKDSLFIMTDKPHRLLSELK